MSLFDALFANHAAPVLMQRHGTSAAVTVRYGSTIISRARAILRHEQDIDEVEGGRVQKRTEKEIDLLTNEKLSWRGLEQAPTNAKVTIHYSGGRDETWSVHEIRNRTSSFIRLLLVRKAPRQLSRSGYYHEEG